MDFFPLIPDTASTFAAKTDPLYWALALFTVAFATGITFILVYLGIKYRHIPGSGRRSVHVENMSIEIIWSVIPLFIALGIFVWGAFIYFDFYNMPKNTLDVSVVGKQWMWKLQHPNGKREVNELHVPVGRPIKLNMTSQDVLHSFYLPAMRVKQDVLPARYTTMWFEATKTGEYPLYCAEYCGTGHSVMGGKIIVMKPTEYLEWLAGGPALSPVERGAQLFEQMGCATCHAAGQESRGPNLDGIFDTEVELTSGDTVTVNEEYIRESIVSPSAKIVEGYSPLMPSFATQLTDEEIMSLVAYVKSLSEQ